MCFWPRERRVLPLHAPDCHFRRRLKVIRSAGCLSACPKFPSSRASRTFATQNLLDVTIALITQLSTVQGLEPTICPAPGSVGRHSSCLCTLSRGPRQRPLSGDGEISLNDRDGAQSCRSRYAMRRSAAGANTPASVVVWEVGVQEAPKAPSTADMRRIADRRLLADSGMAAFGVRRTIADVPPGEWRYGARILPSSRVNAFFTRPRPIAVVTSSQRKVCNGREPTFDASGLNAGPGSGDERSFLWGRRPHFDLEVGRALVTELR